MDWILGCFKCGKRQPAGNSFSRTISGKDGCAASSSAALLSAEPAQAQESSEAERDFSVEGDGLKRNSSVHSNSDRRTCSSRTPSSEQLLLAKKLEEEIDSLNKQLVEEATQATSLANEVRHLRKCSALLDSPSAFKNALSALEQALEKGELEESQPLLYLHTLLSKIEFSEEEVEIPSKCKDEERQAKCFLDDSSLPMKNDKNPVETVQDIALQVELDYSQENLFTPSPVPGKANARQGLMLKDEHSTCKSRPLCSSDVGNIQSNKSQQILVSKKRSSKTLSFSGFLLVEDEEERPISENAGVLNPFSSTELAMTKIIEKTHVRDENLLEASQSLFAFSTGSSQGHSTLSRQSNFGNSSKDFSFSNSDSEDDACFEKEEGNEGFSGLQYRSSRCMWSPQDITTHKLDRVCGGVSIGLGPINAKESSHNRFSEADEISLLSKCCSNSMNYIGSNSSDCEVTESRHGMQMHNSLVKDKFLGKRKVSLGITRDEDDLACRTSPETIASCLSSQGEFSLSSGEGIVELSSPGTTSLWDSDMQASPCAAHTLSAEYVDHIKGRPAGCLSETPSTPASVISCESRLHVADTNARKLNFSPLRTPLASYMQAETPSIRRGSPSSLGEDRPILGTVAAHWNPSSSASSTQKWWDGKGIPNSTNKYKEDQKVSWHATPFEVRLERALAKQGRAFQKKLFTGAKTTEMEAGI